ncbi:glycosyltransferase family 2 protein [uncultured Tateyamaria sp.]|uniref:glycosyltransferase family 2 protein n=1 Tax=uncultured Tateyamaria sp. TaxID=455651 RepID=UPI002639DD1B|nr:glycosyltransferase family 2 protein [uncultured Tateyamaria sp.]
MVKLSIVIPSYNVEDYILQTLSAVSKANVETETIIVDDASSDDTLAICQDYAKTDSRVKVISCPENGGAGVARNIGMKHARGEYIYFLDADDVLSDGGLEKAVHLMDENGCDVLAFKYGYMTSESGHVTGMLSKDLSIWDAIVTKKREVKDVPVRANPRILLTVNYPWNKIVRRDFIERTGLFFSKTSVNNDIYAHWHIYLHASKICLYNETLIKHRVFAQREQITNVFDARRFDAFEALGDVERMILNDEIMTRRYYHYFLQFKLELLKWINGRMDPGLRQEFLSRVRASYRQMDPGLFLQAFDNAPGVASESLTLGTQPQLLLKLS